MLGYEWTNHSSNNNSPPHHHHPQLMLSDVVDNLNNHHHNHNHDHNHDNYGHNNHITSQSSDHHHRPIFDDQFNTHHYTFPNQNHNHNHNNDNNNNYYQTQLFSDPRAFQGASPSMFTLDGLSSGFSPVIPKTEPDPILNRPIGLNLGGRTYFSPDDDLVSRLYRRSRPADVAVNVPKCQAEGCNADLSSAKHYHRRHKVCEFHSKASTVIANGLIQRFCQQCSRFHMLAEFDNGKRSCRKRLADHNRRRRKSHQVVTQDHRMASPMSSENAPTSPSPRSPKSNSGMNSTSSITVAMSPPQVSYDSSFRPRLY